MYKRPSKDATLVCQFMFLGQELLVGSSKCTVKIGSDSDVQPSVIHKQTLMLDMFNEKPTKKS